MLYLIVFLSLLFHAYIYDFRKYKSSSDLVYRIYLVIFILIAGLRYKVGGDTFNYMVHFESIPTLNNLTVDWIKLSVWNPFWILLSSISKTINSEFYCFQLIHATIVNVIIFKSIRKYVNFRFFAILLYFITFYVYFNMEILRESLSICLFLIGFDSYVNKRYLKFSLIALCAVMFHSSAVILILLPIFTRLKFNFLSAIISLFILIILFIFKDYIMVLFLSDTSISKVDNYSLIISNINGIITNLLTLIVVPYLIIVLYRKLTTNPLFKELYIFYFFIATLVVFIPGFTRFLNYFTPFSLLIFTDLIYRIWVSKKYKQIRSSFVLCLTLIVITPKFIYFIADTSAYYPNTRKYNYWYPYSSIFEKDEFLPREIMKSVEDNRNF